MIPKEEAQSLARHVLTGVGLLLVQLGILQQVGIVESMAGATSILAGVVWLVLDKRAQRKRLEAAKAEVPPGAILLPKHVDVPMLQPWCGKCRGPG